MNSLNHSNINFGDLQQLSTATDCSYVTLFGRIYLLSYQFGWNIQWSKKSTVWHLIMTLLKCDYYTKDMLKSDSGCYSNEVCAWLVLAHTHTHTYITTDHAHWLIRVLNSLQLWFSLFCSDNHCVSTLVHNWLKHTHTPPPPPQIMPIGW